MFLSKTKENIGQLTNKKHQRVNAGLYVLANDCQFTLSTKPDGTFESEMFLLVYLHWFLKKYITHKWHTLFLYLILNLTLKINYISLDFETIYKNSADRNVVRCSRYQYICKLCLTWGLVHKEAYNDIRNIANFQKEHLIVFIIVDLYKYKIIKI